MTAPVVRPSSSNTQNRDRVVGGPGMVKLEIFQWIFREKPGEVGEKNLEKAMKNHCWLVVWNMAFIFPYIGNNHPN